VGLALRIGAVAQIDGDAAPLFAEGEEVRVGARRVQIGRGARGARRRGATLVGDEVFLVLGADCRVPAEGDRIARRAASPFGHDDAVLGLAAHVPLVWTCVFPLRLRSGRGHGRGRGGLSGCDRCGAGGHAARTRAIAVAIKDREEEHDDQRLLDLEPVHCDEPSSQNGRGAQKACHQMSHPGRLSSRRVTARTPRTPVSLPRCK
jgi:hypothetical protein